jgi:hypothetical protein
MQEIKLPKGLTADKIIQQVTSEYNASIDFVRTKRDLFRARENLYMDNTNQENKVYVRLIFSVIQTLKALYSANEIGVEFQ